MFLQPSAVCVFHKNRNLREPAASIFSTGIMGITCYGEGVPRKVDLSDTSCPIAHLHSTPLPEPRYLSSWVSGYHKHW
jgi:hypothetical protein